MRKDEPDLKRRGLVAGVATAGLFALAPGTRLVDLVEAKPDEQSVSGQSVSGQRRWGLLIDTAKCTEGCTACVDGCNDEHGLQGFDRSETDAQWIRKLTLQDTQTGRVTSLPMLCQHCEDPPCVDVCPTGASFKRADGIVLVDKHICIGCRYCVLACPYKARSFVHENLTNQRPHSPRGKGTVEGCTMCTHRIDKDQAPACVEACHANGKGAMTFGDVNDNTSAIAQRLQTQASRQVREDLRLNTGVRYQNI